MTNARLLGGACSGTVDKNASKIVKGRLTVQRGGSVLPVLRGSPGLDGIARDTSLCAAMNGLNHICGICREIIS